MSITHTTQGDLFTPFADLNAILSKNTPTQGHPGQWGHPSEHPSWHAGLAITASVRCAHAAQKVCSGSHGRIAHNGLSCHLCHSPGHVCRPFFLKHLLRPSTHSLAFSHFNCYSFFFFPLGALVLFCLILFPCVSSQFLLSLPKRQSPTPLAPHSPPGHPGKTVLPNSPSLRLGLQPTLLVMTNDN